MDTDLIDRLTANAAGTLGEEAAVWLLAEHGHWLPELDRVGLIGNVQSATDTRIKWDIHGRKSEQMVGTASEWQVLYVAAGLASHRGMAMIHLTSLDEQNVRLVLHAIAWAARGRAWADQQVTPPAPPQITPELASHVLWFFNQGGMRPGSFTQRLLETFAAATPVNAMQLREAFPAHGWAMHLAQNTENGIAQLRTIAGESLPAVRSHADNCSHPGDTGPGNCSPR